MTIKDVAKKAGVSISTASYALNNRPNVHPTTKDKVLKAAEELNYYPNAHARNLKSQKSGNIGVFIYGFGGPIFSDLLEGINLELQKKKYNIIVSSGDSSSVMLRERSVDAAVIFDGNISDEEIIRFSNRNPIVVLDRYLEGENIYHSRIQNEKLVYDFITQMIDTKHYRRFGYLSGPEDSFNNIERYKGFQKALLDKGISQYDYIKGDFTIDSGYESAVKLFKDKKLPEFIYCANDELAVGVLKALNEVGISVPNDVAIAGFDGIQLTDFVTPKLTTIKINHFEWGRQIAGYLTRLLTNINVYPLTNPEATIVIGESV